MAEAPPRIQVWFWRVWTLIGAAVALVGLWWFLREPFSIVFGPLALTAVIVYLLRPVVGRLERAGLNRYLGTLTAYVVVFAAGAGFTALVGPTLATQTGELAEQLPNIAADVADWLNRQLARIGVTAQIAFDLDSAQSQEAISNFLSNNRDEIFEIIRGAGTVVGVVFHTLLTLILAPILAFYVLADLPRISQGVERFMPPGSRGEVFDVAQRIGKSVGAYFRGQLLVATFVGVATAIGLAIVGLPFWALVGILTGLFNLIPLVGPFVGGAIGVIIALTVGDGPSEALAVVIVMTLVQQVDNHVITPNIVARTVKVHPVTVILGLLVAGSLFGIVGMLVAIPAIAAAKLIVMYLLVTRVPTMSHLADDGPGLFHDGLHEPPQTGLSELAREMRRAWEKRRRARSAAEEPPPVDPAGGREVIEVESEQPETEPPPTGLTSARASEDETT